MRDKKRERGGVVRGTSYTQATGGGGETEHHFLEGSHPTPARPSDKSIMR